jgi:outer membrane protein OmpA-like peptidoglycan-associated protein
VIPPRIRRATLAIFTAALPLWLAAAEPAVGTVITFVGCPVFRDADNGRKSGCWLADDSATGIRYDISQGHSKPQLGREVLIEGIVAAQDNACGGVVLLPMRSSTLPDSCSSAMIPAEGFPARRYVAPPGQVDPTWVPRKMPEPPFARQSITILFDFGSDFLDYQYSETLLERASLYARASHARVRITGFAVPQPLRLDGRSLAEPLELARRRAAVVAEALRRLQTDPARIAVTGRAAPPAQADAGGLAEASRRRVEILLEP